MKAIRNSEPNAKDREEIERAIDNLKRSAEDRRFRKEWYRAGARKRAGFGERKSA